MARNATLYLDRGRYEVLPERKKKVSLPPDRMARVLSPAPRGQDFYTEVPGEELHLGNWLECIRKRSQPNAPVEAGVNAAAAAHLANKALRTQQIARWDA
jgi:hypothetical protein